MLIARHQATLVRLGAVLTLLSGCSFDAEAPAGETGCCFYTCEDGRARLFSAYYGSDGVCEHDAEISCRTGLGAAEMPEETVPVSRSEWLPEDNDQIDENACEDLRPDWFTAAERAAREAAD